MIISFKLNRDFIKSSRGTGPMKLRQPHISERCQFQRIIPADEDYRCKVSFAVPVKDFFYVGRRFRQRTYTGECDSQAASADFYWKIISHTKIRTAETCGHIRKEHKNDRTS